MCMAALHWARVKTVCFGASISDAAEAGFNELAIPAEKLIADGGGTTQLVENVLPEQCRELFTTWKQQNAGAAY